MTQPTPTQRVTRTAAQGGAAVFVIIILEWVAALAGVDLDPGPGEGLPVTVSAAFQGLMTVAAAYLMNRRPSTPDHEKEAAWPTS